MRNIRTCLILFAICLGSICCSAFAASMATYFVSPSGSNQNSGLSETEPFLSLEKARDVVRTINNSMTGDIEIVLLSGIHKRDSTFRLDDRDGGTNGFKIAYKAQERYGASISGGEQISNWIIHDTALNIYKASWDGLGIDSLGFRQLYVNGKRCIRSREPNLHPRDENDYYLGDAQTDYHELISWVPMQNGFTVDTSEVNHWISYIPSDDYMRQVEACVIVEWEKFFMRLEGFTFTGREASAYPQAREQLVLMKNPYPPKIPGQLYHWENALVFVDMEGEFYCDPITKYVYYKPRSHESDLNTSIVIAPKVDTLIKIEPHGENPSDPNHESRFDTPVKNIVFDGIIFEYTTWMRPSHAGHIPVQAEDYSVLFEDGSRRYHRAMGSVYLKVCDSIRFEHNVFQHMGATALDLHFGCHDNTIIGNIFYDISANGIAEGDLHDSTVRSVANPSNIKRLNARNMLSNNFIHNTGQYYVGAVGIQSGFTDSSLITHNEVYNVPYSGICFGWHGGYTDPQARNNIIRANLVHGVMRHMHDGGGIYVLGTQPGSIIDSNCIYDIYKYLPKFNSFFPLYLDNGANGITVKDNRVYNINSPMVIRFNTSGPNETGANGDSVSELVCINAGITPEYKEIKLFLDYDTSGYSHTYYSQNFTTSPPISKKIISTKNHITTKMNIPHSIKFIDMSGAVLFEQQCNGPTMLDLTNFNIPSGIYILNVTSAKARLMFHRTICN